MRTPTDEEQRQGVRRLRQLLPAARAMLRHAATPLAGTSLITAQARYITQDNFLALLVTRGDAGGWSVDLQLRIVPPGVPNIVGSPVETPYPTQAAAEADAVRYLVFALAMERAVVAGKMEVSAPTFLYYGIPVWLQAELMNRLETLCPNGPPPGITAETCTRDIAAFTAEHFPTGVNQESMVALPNAHMSKLLTMLHTAAFVGVLRHPPRKPAGPMTHPQASTTRH